jgi:Cytochrome P450
MASADAVSNQMVNQCAYSRVMSTSCLVSNNILIVAVICFPEILKKIQAELDSIVGRDRMPTFDDERSLPYLVAFIKEVTRCVISSCLSSFPC